MRIFDSYYKERVELWGRERGLSKVSTANPSSFYVQLKDPAAHREMIEVLENRYKAEECSFRTIFGTFQGHRIYKGAKCPRRSKYRPAKGRAYTTWTSDRTRGTWQIKISSPAETEMNPGSRPTLKFLDRLTLESIII
jgi:hypothetical protein